VCLSPGKTLALPFSLTAEGDDGEIRKYVFQGSSGKILIFLTKEAPMWLGLFSSWDVDRMENMQQPSCNQKEREIFNLIPLSYHLTTARRHCTLKQINPYLN
jgi:hypothetical protein